VAVLDLLAAGAFDGACAAMMVHGADADLLRMDAIAVDQLTASYRGRSAHAAAAPHAGRNALDAAVLGYVNVAALRQHIRDDERIHGVFTDGGDKPNIVPSAAATHWYVRAGTLDRLELLGPRVVACLEAGAAAAGCEVELTWTGPRYADVVDNRALLDLYADNAATLGRRPVWPDVHHRVIGSTDMGNVSHVVPSIHPMIAVADPGVPIHTPEFALAAASPAGDRAVVDGAKAMAMTAIDLWASPDALEAVQRAFEGPSGKA
jgi:metal-dependent amidase/aminoacylase/carboxypeptidase family protein